MAKKKFFARLWQGIVNGWNWLTGKTKKLVPDVVEIVNKIKEVDDAGLLDIITLAIPGDKDDKIVLKYRDVFRQVILALGDVQQISDIEDDEEKIKAIIAKIKGSNPDVQKTFWTGLATLVVEKMTDEHITWGEAIVIVKYVYDNLPKVKEEVKNIEVDENEDYEEESE